MRDVLFPIGAVAFFVLTAGYIRACGRIAAGEDSDPGSSGHVSDLASQEASR